VVQDGESLLDIARTYGVPFSALAAANGLREPISVRPGQRLRLPQAAAPAEKEPEATGKDQARADTKEAATTAGLAAPTPIPVPSGPPAESTGFIWPVAGQVISVFGPKSDGLRNDGINIAAPRGTPVKAIASGVVTYAGNELRGFGNLLLIKHSGGWTTAYAHNEAVLVKRGERVERGQVIARVGNSGRVSEPQLHFELRKGKEAVDPLRYLPKPSV
jgi:murein DD-endopeptidase MepM/ murein hydrolase activator NlpD